MLQIFLVKRAMGGHLMGLSTFKTIPLGVLSPIDRGVRGLFELSDITSKSVPKI